MTDRKSSPDVQTYLAAVPEPARAQLERIREIVWSLAPGAEEVIAYGIPTFKLNGNLVHYAAFKNHCSLFPGSVASSDLFSNELAGFKISRGTIQFTPEHPIPAELISRIVALRIEQNRDKAARGKPRKSTAPAS